MSSPAPFGNLKGGTKELCDGLEPTVAPVTLTSNERTTSFTLAEQSTATASTSITRSSMDKISYKLLSNRRKLVNAIKHLRDDLSGVSSLVSFNKIAPEFHNFVKSYSEFRSEVDKVTDLAHVGELICDLAADYDNLCSSFKDLESPFVGSFARDEDDVVVKASDSVSQASLGKTSSSSRSSAARRIKLECKRASLLAIRDLEKSKAKAKAEAEAKVKEEEAEAEASFVLRKPSLPPKRGLLRFRSLVCLKLVHVDQRLKSLSVKRFLRHVPRKEILNSIYRLIKKQQERGLKLLFLSLCIINLVRLKQNLLLTQAILILMSGESLGGAISMM